MICIKHHNSVSYIQVQQKIKNPRTLLTDLVKQLNLASLKSNPLSNEILTFRPAFMVREITVGF